MPPKDPSTKAKECSHPKELSANRTATISPQARDLAGICTTATSQGETRSPCDSSTKGIWTVAILGIMLTSLRAKSDSCAGKGLGLMGSHQGRMRWRKRTLRRWLLNRTKSMRIILARLHSQRKMFQRRIGSTKKPCLMLEAAWWWPGAPVTKKGSSWALRHRETVGSPRIRGPMQPQQIKPPSSAAHQPGFIAGSARDWRPLYRSRGRPGWDSRRSWRRKG